MRVATIKIIHAFSKFYYFSIRHQFKFLILSLGLGIFWLVSYIMAPLDEQFLDKSQIVRLYHSESVDVYGAAVLRDRYTGFPWKIDFDDQAQIFSNAQLFENGVAMPHDYNSYQAIEKNGKGQYAFFYGKSLRLDNNLKGKGLVYFTTFDNSNPITNNKEYRFRARLIVDPTITKTIWTFIVIVFVLIIAVNKSILTFIKQSKTVLLCFFILLFLNEINQTLVNSTIDLEWGLKIATSVKGALFNLSNNFFKEQSLFYGGDSLLLPFLAALLGTNKSLGIFYIFQVVLQYMLVPIIAIALYLKSESRWIFYLTIGLFIFSRPDLYYVRLQQTDQLTLLFLLIMALSNRFLLILVCSFLASMSHFLLAAFSSLTLICIWYAQSHSNIKSKVLAVIMGLLATKLFITFWFSYYNYHMPIGRFLLNLEFIMNRDEYIFLFRPLEVFYLPSLSFYIVFILLIAFYLLTQKIRMVLALTFSISLAFSLTLISRDGLRIFTVTILAAYLYALYDVVSRFGIEAPKILERIKNRKKVKILNFTI